MVRVRDFDESVKLPPGLTISAVKKSIVYIESQLTDLVELYFEQKNVFSAIVGIFGTRALDIHSVYEKVRHTDIAQTRFPDLRHRSSPVIIWRVDVAYLLKSDWKYEGSKAGQYGGGRTHTFGVVKPATRLKDCALYRRSDIVISGNKALHINGG